METEITDDFVGIVPPEKLSNEDYHARPEVSSSILKLLHDKTPMHVIGSEPKRGAALDRGTAFHTALLEPHDYDATLMRGPADRRGKKWTDAAEAAEKQGKILLTADVYDYGLRVRDVLHDRAGVRDYLQKNNRQIEHSAFAEVDDLRQRVRPDLVLPDEGVMIDPKTTQSAKRDDFQRAIVNYGYHLQAAMYPYVWQAAGGCEIKQFLFLAIEPEPPFATAVYELDHEAFEAGWSAYKNAVHLYRACKETGEWPGYPSSVQSIDLPRWYKTESE